MPLVSLEMSNPGICSRNAVLRTSGRLVRSPWVMNPWEAEAGLPGALVGGSVRPSMKAFPGPVGPTGPCRPSPGPGGPVVDGWSAGIPADQPSTTGPPGPGEGRQGPVGPTGPGNAFIEGRTLPPTNAPGSPASASQGFITQGDLTNRPLVRSTAFLEQIPGLLISNETNGIDANTMFLRGFNLDHGTDFAFFVDGV